MEDELLVLTWGCAGVLYTLLERLLMELGNKTWGIICKAIWSCRCDRHTVHHGFKQAMHTAVGYADDAPSIFGLAIPDALWL